VGDWVRVADAAQFLRGRGRQVDIDGRKIAVFKDGERWFALDDKCPHMGASLSDGTLYGDQLQCVWHEWRYDTRTGKCPVRAWACVEVHEVKVENGGVFVRRPVPPPAPIRGPEEDPEWLSWDPQRFFKKKPAEEE
jgi:nitrite reductase (NADH) small subunit/3-phenylpropionate/trans-cinnamate dioxygenase ferredoxin subunit